MTKFIKMLFPQQETVVVRRPEGKLGLVNKVEIPNRKGFTVVRRDIMRQALAKKQNEAA